MTADPLDLLKDLVRIPSVNPMGRDAAGPEFLETRVSDYLVELFEQYELPYERIDVAPGRSNVIARLDRPGAQTTILLDAHQDTVPVEGMTIDPFDPVERDGLLYGRGACDVKGGMAAMLAAFINLAVDPRGEGANVIFSATCDEEAGQLGMADLVKPWTEPGRKNRLVPRPPDFAIVAEPTDLNIVVAHRGAVRWKLRTTGRACHSSRPWEGINAINRMGRVLNCLEEYAATLKTSVPPHPLCGPATLSVGRIEGGTSINIVPDRCEIEIDRRTLPGEEAAKVIQHIADYLEERLDFKIEMLPSTVGLPLSDDMNGAWADRLLESITSIAGTREKVGALYGTHASRLSAAGVPTVVFGPGSIAQAHTEDEWISIRELRQASEIYYRFCLLGGD